MKFWKDAKWLIALLLGIIVTIGATYYQIIRNENTMNNVEKVRYAQAWNELVGFIEDSIINKTNKDINCYNRMIDVKRARYGIKRNIDLLMLIKNAETNIMESKHLNLKRKEEYEYDIKVLLTQAVTDTLSVKKKYSEKELLARIMKSVPDKDNSEILSMVYQLADKYENRIRKLEKTKPEYNKKGFDIFSILSTFIMAFSIAALGMQLYGVSMRRKKKIQQRRNLYIQKDLLEESLTHKYEVYRTLTDESKRIDLEKEIDAIRNELLVVLHSIKLVS